jgi:polar amino acid transport system substrate-binding protein
MKIAQNKGTLILVLTLILVCQPVYAAQLNSNLKVGISPFTPFVILSPDGPTGMSIDLWHTLALRLGNEFEYVECKGVADKLTRLKEGRIDMAVGGITITEKRETDFDFTYPVYHSGLDILIPKVSKTNLLRLLSALFEGQKIIFFAALLILVVIAGHIMWFVERSSKRRATSFNQRYFPGVFEGMYWALITASTIGYGDKVPQRWIGRILAAIIILIFLPLFGFFVAQLSSDLTMQGLKTNINGPQDLQGRRVAVVDGTTGFEYVKNKHVYVDVFENVDAAIDALLKGEVEAVVYDAPNLLYFANGAGKGKVTVVGKIFEPQDYGLALPQGSPLREIFNRAILNLIESGELERIKLNWFGAQNGN